MSFPPKPNTADERRTKFLELMRVPGYRHVYVLGCFARYVTVYAQQVRALNLVDCLAKGGVFSHFSRVAIIGGGIAGLTAAAAAAARGVARVSVFEKDDNTMRLQRTCHKRYLHPNIYDWPACDPFEENANLPLMNWQAAYAADVVQKLDCEWKKLREQYPFCLQEAHLNCGKITVMEKNGKPHLAVDDERPEQEFDVAVFAVGFGQDRMYPTPSYWGDTPWDAPDAEQNQDDVWFVSGAGDGALTDLMRLCIRDFLHENVLKAVDGKTREEIGKTLLAAEHERDKTGWEFAQVYKEAARKIAEKLNASEELKQRKLTNIWLNSSEDKLFSPKSSVLNRLIVAYLLENERFQFVEDAGHIHGPPERDNTGYRIRFDNGRPEFAAQNVIIRHGPDNALLRGFPELHKRCGGLKQIWSDARQHDDWTRDRLFNDADYSVESLPSLRVDFDNRAGCVVVTGSRRPNGQNQAQRVKGALEQLASRTRPEFIGREIDTQPVELLVEDVFTSSAAYERAVRALCSSEFAVFDITGYESDAASLKFPAPDRPKGSTTWKKKVLVSLAFADCLDSSFSSSK